MQSFHLSEANQAIMPIKLPLPPALKNVSICYNDGGFSYFPLPHDEDYDDDYVPDRIAAMKLSLRRTLVLQQSPRQLLRQPALSKATGLVRYTALISRKGGKF